MSEHPIDGPGHDTVPCVGGIVVDDSGRLLLVRRGREPAKGSWSIPGGRVEPGESDEQATVRELLEETGLRVDVGTLAGTVHRDGPGGAVYAIRDYACTLADGTVPDDVRAGDDADDAGWFTPSDVRRLQTSPGLVDTLEEWRVLPPADGG